MNETRTESAATPFQSTPPLFGSPPRTLRNLLDAARNKGLLLSCERNAHDRELTYGHATLESMTAELVEHSQLTRFQADLLLQGREDDLVLGPYVLLEQLAEGGMGLVFKARHTDLGRLAAVKVIRPDRLTSLDVVQRFLAEARAAACLSHPHVVPVYDAGQNRGTYYLAMEYVQGADLGGIMRDQGALSVRQACDWVRQAAMGLQHAFEHGLIHRDIKPPNLLLDAENNTVKVADFGLALLKHPGLTEAAESPLTRPGTMIGTPDYMSPEQARDAHTADTRSDIYSLGCTHYHLLTGRVPFRGKSCVETLLRHQNETPAPIRQLRREVPQGLADVVTRMMAKNPIDRYQTPAEVVEALARWTSTLEPSPWGRTGVRGWGGALVRGIWERIRAILGR